MGYDHKSGIVAATQNNTADLASWVELAEDIDWRHEQILECIDKPGYQLRLAFPEPEDKDFISDNNTATGLLLAHYVDRGCTLMLVAVDPAARRHGLGRLLMEDLIDQAQNRACEKIYLEVRESNSAAIALYQNLGFVQHGRRKHYYPARCANEPKESALLMQLDLQN